MAVHPSDLYVRVLITGTRFGMGLEYDRGKLHHPMPTHGPCGIAQRFAEDHVFATRG
jgi:hypothetical protein